MTVDRSGEWWTGTVAEDVQEFLTAYAPAGYEVSAFRISTCISGNREFTVDADDEEGVARRTCATCGASHFIGDSGDFWHEASPEHLRCPGCGCEVANIGVGFSIYPDGEGVRWIYVGVRCVRCGSLGCFAGWKVGTNDASLLETA